MLYLQSYRKEDILALVLPREGEHKLGACLEGAAPDLAAALAASEARFVLLGIPEDIGVRANGGIGGAHTAWQSFLRSFLNIQETEKLSGRNFLLAGALEVTGWMEECRDAGTAQLREYTARLDAAVTPLIREIAAAGKIPVVIGGGHNNAYPILKGAAEASGQALNAVNLDAHSDFRRMEGRHSGNGFRYAYEEGFLKKYAMLGLHEAYNSQPVVAELQANPDLLPVFWDDIFIRRQRRWETAQEQALRFVQDAAFGVELDVDCIENALSSAATPVGLPVSYALDYLYRAGRSPNATYLHLPEGVVVRADGQQDIFTGKLLSYLVQAFTKGVLERP